MVQFGLLGPLVIVDGDGRLLDAGGPRQRLLLAMLLTAGGRIVSTDVIIDELWSDEPPASVAGTVQTYVSRLRRLVEPERNGGGKASTLVFESSGYRLRLDEVDLDTVRFERLADEGRAHLAAGRHDAVSAVLSEALSLWRGPALAEYHDRDWARGVAVRLEDRRLAVLDDRIAADLALGRHAVVVGELSALVDAYPFREGFVAQLATALCRAHRQADALRTIDHARRTLRDELGLEISPNLRALEHAILDHDEVLFGPPGAARLAPPSPPTVASTDAPEPSGSATSSVDAVGTPRGALARRLVRRDRELAMLQAGWQAGGTTVVVRGPAGVGKSSVVRELTRWAEAHGSAVLVGRCTAAAQLTPLRAIREALLGAARRGIDPDDSLGPYLPTLAAVVPDWRDPALSPPADWVALLGEAVLRFLSQLGGSATAALVVEDLQWADPETRAVIEYMADNVTGVPVLLVLTTRDGEPGAGSDLTTDMVRRRVADELVVEPLDAVGVVEMARACLDGEDPPAELVDALVARSGGVPLLVEELIAAARGAGWDTVAAAVPGSVLASVELRLEQLPRDGRRLLIAAALLGWNFDWSLAASVAQVAGPRAAELLAQALRLQLVDAEDNGFRFHHALTCDAVRAATPPAELDLLAARALEAIDDGSDDVERCLLGVELATRVGRGDRAAELLLKAARRSVTSGALSSAAGLAVQARALASDAHSRRYDLLLLEISVLQGDTALAVSLGRDLLRRGTDASELADVHLLVGEAELAAGHLHQAAHHAAEVLALEPDDTRRARAMALAAQAAIADDDFARATEQAAQALTLAEAVGDAAVQCEALEVIGRVARGSDLVAAERAFQRAFDVADGASLPVWRVRALQELGTIDLYETLRLDRLRTARAEAAEIGALATMAMVDLQLAAAHNERGEPVDAIAAARRCAEVSAQFGLSSLAMSHAIEAMAHARRGDARAMQQALDEARATSQDVDYVEASVWGNVVPIYHLVRGELADAAAGFDRGMDVLRRRPTTTFPFPGLWALVRTLLDDGGEEARTEVSRLPVDTPVSRRTLMAAEAVALGRNGETVAATARFLEMDAELDFEGGQFRRSLLRLLVAPAAHHDGWGTPEPWLREALARFEHLGLDALAGRCRQELRGLGAAVPRRSPIATSPVPPSLAALGVTGRELDVLRLAASGSTNREMAERLFISPRTVDKHVERLVQKAGVPRSGFAQLLAHVDGLDT